MSRIVQEDFGTIKVGLFILQQTGQEIKFLLPFVELRESMNQDSAGLKSVILNCNDLTPCHSFSSILQSISTGFLF
jgi:hypothetical protein